jgi:hypothetical protein
MQGWKIFYTDESQHKSYKVKGWFGPGDEPQTQKVNFNPFNINMTAVCSIEGIHGFILKKEKFSEEFIVQFLADCICKYRKNSNYNGPIIVAFPNYKF